MSLDVYLDVDQPTKATRGSGIFCRRNGETVEISREEWDAAFPDREPVAVVDDEGDSTTVYEANITHNLAAMANEAGIYESLWRPDEIGFTHARQLVTPLKAGLVRLTEDPERFQHLNPSNGWGSYDGLVRFVRNYLAACERWPDAKVTVSR